MKENTQQIAEVGIEGLKQISLSDPAIAVLLVVLVAAVVVLIWVVVKLWKKLDEKNDKLYLDAKADFKLVLAFERKLDDLTENESLKLQDMAELKLMVKDVRDILFRNNHITKT